VELISDSATLCDEVSLEMSNSGSSPSSNVCDIFPFLKVLLKTEPSVSIPAFYYESAAMSRSVGGMEGFAQHVAETFETFNGRIDSCKPGNASLAFIRERVFEIQHRLNEE
jgi:hypothetical protein